MSNPWTLCDIIGRLKPFWKGRGPMFIALWLWMLVGGVIDRDVRESSTTMSTAMGERGTVQVLEDGTPQPPPKP